MTAVVGDAAIRGLVLMGAVAGLLFVFRVKRPSEQLRIWRIAIVVSLLMPVVTALVPRFGVPTPIPDTFSSVGTTATLWTVASSGNSGTDDTSNLSWMPARPLAAAVFIVYAGGVLLMFAGGVLGFLRARRLTQGARFIEAPSLQALAEEQAAALDLRSLPRLAQAPTLRIPIASGVIRPVVVLPESWRQWNEFTLRAVLLHEFSHIQRQDALTVRLALAMRAVFWPNPFTWWITRQVIRLAENASDEATLSAGLDRVDYAQVLARFMSVAGREIPGAHLAIARSGRAERRVQGVLNWRRNVGMSTTANALLLTTVAVALTGTAVLRPEPIIAAIPDLPLTHQRMLPEPKLEIALPAPPNALGLPVPASARTGPQPPVMQPPHAQSQPTQVDRTWDHLIPNDDWTGKAVRVGSPGLTPPRLVNRVIPKYTVEAMRAKVQGEVIVQAIVDVTGTVTNARVIGSLHQELDETALVAVRQWTFVPATLGGKTETVWLLTSLQFRIH